ncbi:MAG: T9SS type A sorting domain-containing protein [Bacteroidota bacterium]
MLSLSPYARMFLCLLFTTLYNLPLTSQSCTLSELNLISFTNNGATQDFVVEVCIGGGRLGTATGAGNTTKTFAIAFDNGGSAVNITNLSLASITSDSTGETANASIQGTGLGFDASILFVNSSTNGLACISSTAACGEPHAQCYTISFTTDVLVNSIEAIGVEGNGNPFAGCTDPDMIIGGASLPVELVSFRGAATPNGAALYWSTATERINEGFEIQHSLDGTTWETIGFVQGAGTSQSTQHYEFVDQAASPGLNYYRLEQFDFDGASTYSPTISVKMDAQDVLWQVFPNPVHDGLLTIKHQRDSPVLVQLFNSQGSLQQQSILTHETLDLSALPAGIYVLQLETQGTRTVRKIQVK